MADLIMGALAVGFWAITIAKFREPAGLSPGGPWLRRTFLFLALAATLFVAPVDHLGESLTGLHLAQPLARTSLLGAAFSAQELLRRLIGSTERGLWTRVRVVAFGAGGVLLWTAFVLGSIDGATEFGSRAAPALWPAVFIIVFLVIFGFAVAEVMLGCYRYARTAHGPLAVGLRLIANGCGFALGYVAVKFVAEALALVGSPIPFRVEAVLGQLLGLMAGALVGLGASWAAARRKGLRVLDWLRSYRANRRLYPLWKAVIGPSHQLALNPPGNVVADCLTVRHLRLRLYRRVIEIRDGQLALRDRLDRRVFMSAMKDAERLGLSAPAASAFAEAKLVEHAVAQDAPVHSEMGAWPRGDSQGDSLESEVARLVAVSSHLRRSGRAGVGLRVNLRHSRRRLA